MNRKPFEIAAECEMAGFPTGADIARLGEHIETARRSRPDVVQATMNPPAVYRERRYVLQTRFVVWAEDGARAIRTVEGLLKDARVPCRTVHPSGRALTGTEVPPRPEPAEPRRAAASPRAPAARRRPQKRKPRASSPRPGRRKGQSF